MTMTTDQCFDEMAVALGVPKDTGYIDLLAMVKKLKKETEELKHKEYCLRQDAKGYSPSEVQEYREETEELKEQNQRMKRYIDSYEVKYCEKCLAYHMDTEEYGHGGVFHVCDGYKGCYMCDDCYDDLLVAEEKCEEE
jgi:hypothetical protein